MARAYRLRTPEQIVEAVEELCEYMEKHPDVHLHKACANLGISRTLIYHWIDGGKLPQVLVDKVDEARANVIERIMFEMDAISTGSYRDGRESRPKEKGANVMRDKMILDHRKWLISKLMPNRFGESSTDDESSESHQEININFVNR